MLKYSHQSHNMATILNLKARITKL